MEVLHPRFLSVPGMFKTWDGLFLALCALPVLRRLQLAGRLDVLDAHFGYPDGYAATLLGCWLNVPVTVTLRGTEVRHAAMPALRRKLIATLGRAARVFTVSDSLRRLAQQLGTPADKLRVVGNGVDSERFRPIPRQVARAALGLDEGVPVLITVGGLTERKGFHRVIECLPALRVEFPGLIYLVIGGASAEGDWRARLEAMVRELGLVGSVRFLGEIAPDELCVPLSAADAFVLATRNEGWANVFLEAMACGLPVVTTDVGGNLEVVAGRHLGIVVPFGDHLALAEALRGALAAPWDRETIRLHAEANDWEQRVKVLFNEFQDIAQAPRVRRAAPEGGAHGRH